jgi:hypothetical protein
MKCRVGTIGSACALLGATFLLSAVAGCGGSDRTRVSGRFLRADGTPLVGAAVTARSNQTGKWAAATTDENGHFALGAEEGAGLPPGDYYVIIMEDPEGAGKPRTIAAKYISPSSSGLALSIKAGEPTELNVTLDPP